MNKPIIKQSNAPTPISPVRGSSYRPPTWKKADWNHWEQMPHCKIWDIVALSLDLEPSSSKHEIRTWPPEYVKRMQITDAHIECGKLTRSNADWHSIDMCTYGTWALSLGWNLPDRFPHGEVVKVSAPIEITHTVQGSTNPWDIADPKDPAPKQPWYTPARYLARQLVKDDSTLLLKREILADKTSQSLASAGIYKRGGKKPLMPSTILQAFNNIILG